MCRLIQQFTSTSSALDARLHHNTITTAKAAPNDHLLGDQEPQDLLASEMAMHSGVSIAL